MDTAVEQWARFEVRLAGPSAGNPFVDVQLSAEFSNGQKRMRVDGFYDGEGVYRIRFMPTELGQWSYVTESNVDALSGQSGAFACAIRPAQTGTVRCACAIPFTSPMPTARPTIPSARPALGPSGRRAGGANARNAEDRLQQDAHVRLSQRLHLQQRQACVLSV